MKIKLELNREEPINTKIEMERLREKFERK